MEEETMIEWINAISYADPPEKEEGYRYPAIRINDATGEIEFWHSLLGWARIGKFVKVA
jgi:hypothetical protein